MLEQTDPNPDQDPDLDIVIPTLDAVSSIGRVVTALSATAIAHRITIVDGGSTDGTQDGLAGGVRLLAVARGRGSQLAEGGAAASAPWLLFWHADTLPGNGWEAAVRTFMHDAQPGQAGYFRFRLDDQENDAARRLERMVAWRCRTFGLAYGDQGLLIRRAEYEALGGYRPLPIMEDVDLVRRIGRRNMREVAADAVTSAARYRRDGYVVRTLRNLVCLALYFAGAPAARIAALYR